MPPKEETAAPATCGTCKFWLSLGSSQGVCRAHPPTAGENDCDPRTGLMRSPAWRRWPICLASEWCGEFKAK